MKRHGHLMEQLCQYGHLYRSFKKAFKGSGHTRESQAFYFALENRLINLSEKLAAGTYYPGPYRYFYIHEPKKRKISVASFEDRVVHHAVVGLLEPIYEACFIYDSYATRKGKGTQAAVRRAQYFLRHKPWFFKADIKQYFAHIDHQILMTLIQRKVKDGAFLNLVERLISNGGIHGKGLPIGNLTSQFFANVYLNHLDYYVKQTLKSTAYVRYMDDFVLFYQDKLQFISSYYHD